MGTPLRIKRLEGAATIACLLVCLSSTHSLAQSSALDLPEANPARPTVSNPATLTPVGYLQFETGILLARTSPEFSSRVGLNQVTKLTVHRRLELGLQSEPLVRSRFVEGHAFDAGGVAAGVQCVLLPGREANPTISVAYYGSIYSGTAPDLDLGSFQHSLVILLSSDVAGFHVDANGIVSEQKQGAVRRAQYGQTLSVSHAIGKLGLAGEIWHFTQPFLKGNTVGNLWAVTYAARQNLVLDAGFNYGFMATSTRWSIFAGFTYVLPHRLWKERTSRKS
jgi:hypothetical protein